MPSETTPPTRPASISSARPGPAATWAVALTTNPLPGAQDGWWWQDNSLAPATQYCYRLRARNGAVYSAYTTEFCASTTVVAGTPAAPSNLGVYGATSNSLIVAFRDNATNETGVDIERKTGAGGTWAVALTTSPLPGAQDGWWWQDNSLAPATQYCYRLRAQNGAVYSAYTNEFCASTTVVAGTPAAPSNLGVYGPTSNSLIVAFRDNATNETWHRYRAQDGCRRYVGCSVNDQPAARRPGQLVVARPQPCSRHPILLPPACPECGHLFRLYERVLRYNYKHVPGLCCQYELATASGAGRGSPGAAPRGKHGSNAREPVATS